MYFMTTMTNCKFTLTCVKFASAADAPKANYSYLYFEFQQPPKTLNPQTSMDQQIDKWPQFQWALCICNHSMIQETLFFGWKCKQLNEDTQFV